MLELLNTPWKLTAWLGSKLSYPYLRIVFLLNHIPWGKGWQFHGVPLILKHRQSEMRFGDNLGLRSSLISNPLGPNHAVMLCTWLPGARLIVGDHFAMTGGAICCTRQVLIGNHVAVGANCTIVDTDFHPLDPDWRRLHPQQAASAPVVIEDDVFVGMNALILKGVTLGAGCVVGAGSVVSKNVPPRTIVAGNPARVIREV